MTNPDLLRLGREALGLTQKDLSERSGLPQPEISRWERGLRAPTPQHLDQLAQVLDVPVSVLKSDVRLSVPVHRVARAETKRIERMVNARIEFARLAASRIFVDIDIATPFAFPTPEEPTPPDPEAAAEAIRRVWRIPPGPVADLTTHIENAGAIVLRVDFGVETVLAAYSHLRDDHRWCFLNTRAFDGARARFSLAHELGHALLHWDRFDAPSDKDAEREAHRFAAALLMPANEMRVLFGGSRLSLNELLVVRRQWKVSAQALIMRAYDLGLLSASQRARYFQQINARGWRRAEPGVVDLEQPALFAEALKMHRTHHGYLDEEIATLAGLPLSRLADLMPDYFDQPSPPRPRLSIVKP